MTLIAYGSKGINERRAVSAQERRYALDVSSHASDAGARPGSAGSVGTLRLDPSQERVRDVAGVRLHAGVDLSAWKDAS